MAVKRPDSVCKLHELLPDEIPPSGFRSARCARCRDDTRYDATAGIHYGITRTNGRFSQPEENRKVWDVFAQMWRLALAAENLAMLRGLCARGSGQASRADRSRR